MFGYLGVNLAKSFSDNVVSPTVTPKIGSIVYCELVFGLGDHSGVYVGNGNIVHLNGDGLVEAVSPKKFINRLGGLNSAITIYTSCSASNPVGSPAVAGMARSMIGSKRNYNFILDNCHQFCSGCISGDFENPHNFMWMLKDEAKKRLGVNNWLAWETTGGNHIYDV